MDPLSCFAFILLLLIVACAVAGALARGFARVSWFREPHSLMQEQRPLMQEPYPLMQEQEEEALEVQTLDDSYWGPQRDIPPEARVDGHTLAAWCLKSAKENADP
jgi:hypothetical protein